MQLKAIVISKLDITEKEDIAYPVLLPAPKVVTEFNGNIGWIFNSQCNIQFLNVANPEYYINDLNESLRQFTGINIKKVLIG